MSNCFASCRAVVIALSLLALSACADNPLEQPKPPAAQFSSNANTPIMHPNSEHYREQHVPHGSGRSGSASLTATALMDRNGQTILELAPNGGTITKVQLKLSTHSTLNFNGLSQAGPWTRALPNLVRHQPLQTQASIRGADGRRTDVVTVIERVNERPDLSVVAVSAPAAVAPGTNVTILAAVAEHNGDVGATGNCVLYVNDVAADRSNGVWVADGDEVTCAFSHEFDAIGNYTLRVAIESVVPGDWDTSNNSATSQLAVIDPVLHGNADITDKQMDTWEKYQGSDFVDLPLDDYVDSYNYEAEHHERDQYASVYASSPAQWGNDFSVNVVLKTGGAFLDAATAESAGGDCAYNWSAGFNIESCSSPTGSYVHAYRWSGSTWYWSHYVFQKWHCYYYYTPSFGYTCTQQQNEDVWSGGSTSDGTTYVDLGDDVSFDVGVQIAGTPVFSGAVTVPFNAWEILDQFDDPWHCADEGPNNKLCLGSSRLERQRAGSATF